MRPRLRQSLIWMVVGTATAALAIYLLFQPAPGAQPAASPVDSLAPVSVATSRGVALGKVAPQFAGRSLRDQGKSLQLSDFRGQTVLLNFFASWCPPCAAEVPELQKIWVKHRDRGVVVLGVAILDDYEEAQAFLTRHNATYPAVFDARNEVMDAYDVTSLPTSVFITADGEISSRFLGPFVGEEGVAELIRRLMQSGARIQ